MRYRVAENRRLSDDVFSLVIQAPDAAKTAMPGQFLDLKVPFDNTMIMRRPISICDVTDDTVTVAIEIKGRGTYLLSSLKANDDIDMIGPLGKGFPVVKGKKAALVGGGIGIFPLLFLKNVISKDGRPDCYLGFRNSRCIMMAEEFMHGSNDMCISTDDGSSFNPGHITSHFQKHADKYDIVYACGPLEMLKAVKNICEAGDIPLYISIEQRMGCGIGACLVCACKTRSGDGSGYDFKHVCKDGPVFDSKEVIL
jgi:dihydroorotate dehydrogenase electron transfer subunit